MLTISDPARSGRQPGERLEAPAGATVGREPGNTLVLREDTVSARHAVLRHERGRWLLEDLDSTNGTFVNGRPVHGTVRLGKGDEVRFGHVALRFEG